MSRRASAPGSGAVRLTRSTRLPRGLLRQIARSAWNSGCEKAEANKQGGKHPLTFVPGHGGGQRTQHQQAYDLVRLSIYTSWARGSTLHVSEHEFSLRGGTIWLSRDMGLPCKDNR